MSLIAYFDCFAGASGDMLLGALLDAGLPFEALAAEIEKLRLPSGAYELSASLVDRAGIAATKAEVVVKEPPRHRSLADILGIIDSSALYPGDKARVSSVFDALARAEARVHGQDLDEVELHEVGAVDAMVDVTGVVSGLRLLGVDSVYVSPLPLGHGEVKGRHGVLPVPAPATLELIRAAGAPFASGEGPAGEMVTPTGAALLTTLGAFRRPAMSLQRTGYGAGSRNPADRPNVVRLWIGVASEASRPMRLVETNIDDMTPEMLAYVQELLLVAGANDVWLTPIQMKKGRPAVKLSLICREAAESDLVRVILRESSTLGVRASDLHRYEAERDVFEFESSLGPAAVKVKRLPGEELRVAAEFDPCRLLAQATGLPLPDVYRTVEAEAKTLLQRMTP